MVHSFLLIGQSNMAGRGRLDEAIAVDTTHIKVLRNGRWQKMFRPINPDRSFSGVNLAESFAERYAKKYGVDVGLICCADGGTRLEQWAEGSILFDSAVSQAKLAMRSSSIEGVLWHQGEADCAKELSATYEVRFVQIMNALRKKLGLHDIPFLLGGLGDFLPNHTENEFLVHYQDVNEALQNIAKNNPMTGFVPAHGLGANADNLHFSAKALYEFGHRYFDVYETVRRPDRAVTETVFEDSGPRSAMELL